MTARSNVTIWCDAPEAIKDREWDEVGFCLHHTQTNDSAVTDARRTAKGEGWVRRHLAGILSDLCPHCWAHMDPNLSADDATPNGRSTDA